MTAKHPRDCPVCGRSTGVTILGKLRKHKDPGTGDHCDGSDTFIPTEHRQLPPERPQCQSSLPRSNTPATGDAQSASLCSEPELPGKTTSDPSTPGASSTKSPTPAPHGGPNPWRPPLPTGRATTSAAADTPKAMTAASSLGSRSTSATTPTVTADVIPGVDEYADSLAARQVAAYRDAVGYAQPSKAAVTGYAQPAKSNPVITEAVPMGDLGTQITTMVKEIFYQYTNRTGRSSQKRLGPSQIGTPCDRRLVMNLLDVTPVNPGGDNWASFIGTCIHSGLAEMFTWADAGKGRFVTEMSLELPSELVPHGTADLLDRVLFMVDDHKAMGQWPLDKLKRVGPSPTYRVQLHTYAFGARVRGERIDHVALIAWPRDKSDLSDLYVWTEPYDPTIARDALARVTQLSEWVDKLTLDGANPIEIASLAAMQDDCSYCPYHLKNAKDLRNGGCNGRR